MLSTTFSADDACQRPRGHRCHRGVEGGCVIDLKRSFLRRDATQVTLEPRPLVGVPHTGPRYAAHDLNTARDHGQASSRIQ
jgi:hypothetical protein